MRPLVLRYLETRVIPVSRMKIAYCLPDEHWIDEIHSADPKDAAHIQQRYISEGLRARGHSLTFAAPRDLEDIVYKTEMTGMNIAPRSWTASRWFSIIRRIAWKFQQYLGVPYLNVFSNLSFADGLHKTLAGHNIVFERNSLYNAGVARASKKLGIPYVLFFDADQIAELEFTGTPLTGWLLWRAQSLLYENLTAADRIVCVSEQSKEHLVERWGVPKGKISVIPNAVDTQRFRPDPEARKSSILSAGWDKGPLIVFVGNFYKWHDVRTLLEAFAILLSSNPKVHLVLVGDGTEHARMIEHSRDLGIEPNVLFTGRVPHAEIPGLINSADIAVAPVPEMEQNLWLSPMKLYEYMASGKPIIATSTGQLREVIRDGENGLLVPAGDAAELAAAMARLIAEPPLRVSLGTRAREDALKHHSWEKYARELEQIFEELHGSRDPDAPQTPSKNDTDSGADESTQLDEMLANRMHEHPQI